MKLGFIGAGKVGTTISLLLARKGYVIAAVASRTFTSAQKLSSRLPGTMACTSAQDVADRCDLVFITTPDDAIASVVKSTKWHQGQSIIHCSGADSVDVLEPAKKSGAQVGTFHPLQTFADIDQTIKNLPGSTIGIEAEGPLLSTLKSVAEALACKCVKLQGNDKVLYHASAVIACNYLVTLVNTSARLWHNFGSSRQEAVDALMPLLKGTLNNIENVGLPGCLTGPIARGDTGTVKKHLEVLDESFLKCSYL